MRYPQLWWFQILNIIFIIFPGHLGLLKACWCPQGRCLDSSTSAGEKQTYLWPQNPKDLRLLETFEAVWWRSWRWDKHFCSRRFDEYRGLKQSEQVWVPCCYWLPMSHLWKAGHLPRPSLGKMARGQNQPLERGKLYSMQPDELWRFQDSRIAGT